MCNNYVEEAWPIEQRGAASGSKTFREVSRFDQTIIISQDHKNLHLTLDFSNRGDHQEKRWRYIYTIVHQVQAGELADKVDGLPHASNHRTVAENW